MPRVAALVAAMSVVPLAGCAQTWGLGDRTAAVAEPQGAPARSDAEIDRLSTLADELEAALAELDETLAKAEQGWLDADTEEVRSGVAAQQKQLEHRLVLSVALANIRAAIDARRSALEEGREPEPGPEPIPATLDEVVEQAEHQVRAARDRLDADRSILGGERADDPVDGAGGRPGWASPPAGGKKEGAPRKKDDGRKGAIVVEPPPARVDLQAALMPHFAALQACVPDGAAVKRVIVRGRLSADGQLHEVRVLEGVSIPAIVGCLTDRLETITVAMPEGARGQIVTFPLLFADHGG